MKKYFIHLNIIFATEVVIVALTSFGLIPREAILFSTGLVIFYMIFSPVEDSLYLIVMSIPLFGALPLSESFDSMANWRVLIAVLLLCLFFKKGISISLVKNSQGKWHIRENIKHYLVEYLTWAFLAVAAISILAAGYKVLAVKKLLFLINVSLLFLIIRNTVKSKGEVIRLLKAAAVGAAAVMFAALIQFFTVLIVPLFKFWQFWADNVIATFYGRNLSDLLSYSNTWFAYYASNPPTLRLFSVFPDSHSFAMFLLLAVPVFLALGVYRKNPPLPSFKKEGDELSYSLFKERLGGIFWWVMTALALFGVVLSGSRGAWLSVLPVIAIALYIHRNKFEPILAKKAVLTFGLFVIIFLLSNFYPPALYKFQSWQGGQNASSTFSFFQRARSISDLEETSNKGRLEIWRLSFKSLVRHPFLGVGLGNYVAVLGEDVSAAKKGASAHNLYLDFANEIGIFGALILALIFLEILRASWRVFRQAKEAYFKAFGLLFLLYFLWVIAYSLFDVVFLNDKVFLFFMVGAGALYSIKSLDEKEYVSVG